MKQPVRFLVARSFTAAAIAAGLLFTAGCAANDNLANQFRSGDNKEYIAGDGTVTEFRDAATRKTSAAWTGVTESGGVISNTDLVGHVVVMNFWYAGCAPCRAEVPDLQKIADKYAADGLQVLGVNVRDSAQTSLAFDRRFGLKYPSVIDAANGNVVLAFTGIVTPSAVPTTLVLDRHGRVSARILGRFEPATLRALVKTVLEEQ